MPILSLFIQPAAPRSVAAPKGFQYQINGVLWVLEPGENDAMAGLFDRFIEKQSQFNDRATQDGVISLFASHDTGGVIKNLLHVIINPVKTKYLTLMFDDDTTGVFLHCLVDYKLIKLSRKDALFEWFTKIRQ